MKTFKQYLVEKKQKSGGDEAYEKFYRNEDRVDEKLKDTEIRMSLSVYNELRSLEADTVDGHSPDGKKKLASALNNAKKRSAYYVVDVDDVSREYLIKNSIPNAIDIHRDNMNSSKVRAFKKFLDKIK